MSGTAACGAMPSHGGRYLTSTVAPLSSSCFLNFSESAFATPVRQTVFRVNRFADEAHALGDRQPRTLIT
jgi:hypothetical protein